MNELLIAVALICQNGAAQERQRKCVAEILECMKHSACKDKSCLGPMAECVRPKQKE